MTTKNYSSADSLPNALKRMEEIDSIMSHRELILFLDYDGTLAPIVSNPNDAVMSERTRDVIVKLSEKIKVALVSGRDRADVENKVGLSNLIYAGSHGFDIKGPENLTMETPGGDEILFFLDQADQNLKKELQDVKGAIVERKKYAIAVHFRNVEEQNVAFVLRAVEKELQNQQKLKKGDGKKIVELKPNIDWHKGRAVLWLMEKLSTSTGKKFPMFIGDDLTDEDALKAVEADGIGILVGSHGQATAALYGLSDIDEVTIFLEKLYQRF